MVKVGAGRLETCWSCRRPVFLAERLVAGGKLRHRTCFTCKRCGHQLNIVECYETESGDFVCETCPDEEKKKEFEPSLGEIIKDDVDLPIIRDVKDEYSVNFEEALDAIIQNRQDDLKTKFLQDFIAESSNFRESNLSLSENQTISMYDLNESSSVDGNMTQSFPSENVDKNQHITAKIKSLLGKEFSETLSLLNKEPESFIADISQIIDNIISDAVQRAEGNTEDDLKLKVKQEEDKYVDTVVVEGNQNKLENTESTEVPEIKNLSIASTEKIEKVKENEEEDDRITVAKQKEEASPKFSEKSDDYPEDLNPFAEDDDDDDDNVTLRPKIPQSGKPPVTPRKPPVPARTKAPRYNQAGQKIIEAPALNLNPFWSNGEPSSEEEDNIPTPTPRASLRYSDQGSPFSRSQYGSFTSLSSIGSSASAFRRKKGPAPQPPSTPRSLRSTLDVPSPQSLRSPSPTSSIHSHRKSKPAPPPPPLKARGKEDNELVYEKKEKNYENKIKQNLSSPDKSSYGKWKRKKNQAPALPIPQRRRITPLPLPELFRELEDLEIQQRELERQGVNVEQTIRKYESESLERGDNDDGGKDVEGLILQLFEIVNQKNELFRRQAELMYLRRQQRLEEEHADIEYQIRCLMGRPERNKTDSDKAQEEELIRRLVEVVERRNEIIECLDMDRKREVEEDESIHHHLEAFAGKKETPEKIKTSTKGSPSLLKYIKKKKLKKGKSKEPSSSKIRRDADKDIDEAGRDEEVKTLKSKKKWFV